MAISGSRKKRNKSVRHAEYYELVKVFDKLYADSKNGAIFTELMKIIISEENIKLAYRNIKRNSGSVTAGIDGLTINELEKYTPDVFVNKVQRKLTRYMPKAVKRVEIPKPNGGKRPLGIPTIWDRVVQQCILQVLDPICEAKFSERSHGFRPNRSAENAIAQCDFAINKQKLHFVVDIDIKGFFDNVNHSKLIKQIWTLGIRDKRLICIIKQMLQAPIQMPDGKVIQPTKGTPQGGILSPLLSNIVLNELDWWVSSQWETMPMHKKYTNSVINGVEYRNIINQHLKKTKLKEMYIVRYADDFKIFCRFRSDANKVFIAVKQWLWDRLKLEISEEKSKVINLKKCYSEYLGFKMKAVKKSKKYVVRSHMNDKAVKRETEKLIEQIKKIRNPRNEAEEYLEISRYNSMVMGIHEYYRIATNISLDCGKMAKQISIVLKNRLGKRLKKKLSNGETFSIGAIREKYGKSAQIRFIRGNPLVPIGYAQTKNAMWKKRSINKYTPSGREEIHKSLKINMKMLLMLMENPVLNRSIEYADNRISLYSAQHGKCAITGKVLEYEEIHCHHKIPLENGGTDRYNNLIIIHIDVHRLIHATQQETIDKYLEIIKPKKTVLGKINKLRQKLSLPVIEIK